MELKPRVESWNFQEIKNSFGFGDFFLGLFNKHDVELSCWFRGGVLFLLGTGC